MKKILSILLIIAMAVSIAACGSPGNQAGSGDSESSGSAVQSGNKETTQGDTDSKEDIVVSVIFKQLGNAYWTQAQKGAEAAGADLGVTVNVLSPITSGSNDEQVTIIEQSIAQKVDAIVLSPNDSEAIIPAAQSIMDQGIPLINMATAIGDNTYDVYLGVENYQIGYSCANALCEIGEVKGKALIVEGPLGQQNAIDRADGAQAAFEENEIEVASRQTANFLRAEAFTVVQNVLQTEPELKYIFCANDEMALGAMEAVARAGREGEVFIGGVDAVPEAAQAILDGRLTCSASQDSYGQAYRCVEMAVGMAKGETFDNEVLEAVIVTKDIAEDYL